MFTAAFDAELASIGVDLVHTAPQASRTNSIAERRVRPSVTSTPTGLITGHSDPAQSPRIVARRRSPNGHANRGAGSPAIWPAVTINGRHYMNGGCAPWGNADYAAGASWVTIFVQLGAESPVPVELSLAEMIARLRADGGRAPIRG